MSTKAEAGALATRTVRHKFRMDGIWSALSVMAVGLLATFLVYRWIYELQAHGVSPAALAMADMDMKDMHKYWSFPILQASGLVGLFFAYFSVLLGLQQSGRMIVRSPSRYRQINRLHRHLSLVVVTLVVVHVIATAADAMGDSWKTVLVPGQWTRDWPEAVTGYNTGIIATYLLLVLGPTYYYIRRKIGTSRWRFLHRVVPVFYILSFWHAMILGLDIPYYAWIRPVMWLSQVPLLYLLMRRLRGSIVRLQHATTLGDRLAKITCMGLFATSAAAIIAIPILVLTGHSGFIATV